MPDPVTVAEVASLAARLSAEDRKQLAESILQEINHVPRNGPPLESGDDQPRELAAPGWHHLVVRKHPWRRQLYLRGRNMTVRQMVGKVIANAWNEEAAARNLDLPVEAIREALRYAEDNQELLNYETAYEHLLLAQKGYRRVTPPLP